MISTIALLPALLVPSAVAPAPAQNLLAAIPQSAFLAIHSASPKALIAARETNDWIALATDPEWHTIAQLFAEMFSDDESEGLTEWTKTVYRGLSDSTGMVLFMDADLDGDGPILGVIATGGADTEALLRSMIQGELLPDALVLDGKAVLVTETGDELFHSSHGLYMVIFGTTDTATRRVASECFAAMDGPAPRGPFALPGVAAERQAANVEIAIDLSGFWSLLVGDTDDEPVGGKLRIGGGGDRDPVTDIFLDAGSSIEWIYGSVSFGKDEESDWEVVLPYGTETLLGTFLGFCGRADTGLFATVPAGASEASIVAFDVSGCADWMIEVVRELSPETHVQLIGGLSAVTEMVGIDIRGDVIQNITGQVLSFSSAKVLEVNDVGLMGLYGTTVIVAVEDTEPFLDIVDGLLEMAGLGATVVSDTAPVTGDEDGMELWRVDTGVGINLTLGAGAGRILASDDDEGAAGYLALASGAEGAKSFLSDPAIAAAAQSVSGCVVTVQRMGAMADSIDSLVESLMAPMEFFGAESEEFDQAAEAMDRVAALSRRYIDGTAATEVQVTGGRIRYRLRTR